MSRNVLSGSKSRIRVGDVDENGVGKTTYEV
jgi:hypothetical protein